MLVNFDPLRDMKDDSRTHPWSKTVYEDGGGFYTNFLEEPDKIPLVLEDFIPHAHQPSIEYFYDYLRWINGDKSPFETNDCALREKVIRNNDGIFKKTHMIDGRVEFFFRDQIINCDKNSMTWLARMLSLYLQVYRPDFLNGLIDIQLAPTNFIYLPPDKQSGYRIRLIFRAYGNGDTETWTNLFTVFRSIRESTERCTKAMSEGNTPTFP